MAYNKTAIKQNCQLIKKKKYFYDSYEHKKKNSWERIQISFVRYSFFFFWLGYKKIS